jgi:hypothetical protein
MLYSVKLRKIPRPPGIKMKTKSPSKAGPAKAKAIHRSLFFLDFFNPTIANESPFADFLSRDYWVNWTGSNRKAQKIPFCNINLR